MAFLFEMNRGGATTVPNFHQLVIATRQIARLGRVRTRLRRDLEVLILLLGFIRSHG